MTDIRQAQNANRNLRRQLAKAHFYKVGNRWHFAGTVIALVLALGSPFVLVYKPTLGPTLGAAAGIWIFLARILFEPVKERYQTKGATAQELFDCDVLGLTWNDALIRIPADEDIYGASHAFDSSERRHRELVENAKGWYAADVDMPWPKSVITCQRSNAVWARRQHRDYGVLLFVVASSWGIAGIFIALANGATLAAYLTTIALPSLPALLDATELSRRHLKASAQRQTLEATTEALFNKTATTDDDLREVQDQIFELRRDAPPVAGWFYRLLRPRYEAAMTYAAKQRAGSEE
jgi:hypothetical protein